MYDYILHIYKKVQKCMNEKINIVKKDASSKIVASRKRLTPLQTTTIGLLMIALIFISISSMVTYSSNKKPSENILNNSQTIRVLNQ